MKRKLITSNTFKTKDKKPVCFQIFKTNRGTSFIVRDYHIIFRLNSTQSVNKEDIKRIKKGVREFMKKYELYYHRLWRSHLGDKTNPEEFLFRLFRIKKVDALR